MRSRSCIELFELDEILLHSRRDEHERTLVEHDTLSQQLDHRLEDLVARTQPLSRGQRHDRLIDPFHPRGIEDALPFLAFGSEIEERRVLLGSFGALAAKTSGRLDVDCPVSDNDAVVVEGSGHRHETSVDIVRHGLRITLER